MFQTSNAAVIMRKTHTAEKVSLPPLNLLRSFEAAFRHQSFTRAAAELGVTQGAVSRAVGILEDHLGVPLFERTGSGLVPTPGCIVFARDIQKAFTCIVHATKTLTTQMPETPVLTVRTYSGFLLHWLLPHLPEFRVRHPEVDLRLVSSNDAVQVAQGQVDARIRYGHGRWRGVESVMLFADELCPVCAPSLLDPAHGPYPLETLRDATLIHQRHTRGDWDEWLQSAGAASLQAREHLVFEELGVAYEAALSGLGIALGQRRHLRRELAAGTLFEPFPHVLRRNAGYYLTYTPDRLAVPGFAAFRDWLVEISHR